MTAHERVLAEAAEKAASEARERVLREGVA